jgi:hypothetical protein
VQPETPINNSLLLTMASRLRENKERVREKQLQLLELIKQRIALEKLK